MSDFDIRKFYARYVDAINAHDWDLIGDLMHDTVLSHGQTVTREQGVAAFRSIAAAMPDYQEELVTVTVAGDTIASHSITRGTPGGWACLPTASRSRSTRSRFTRSPTASSPRCRTSGTWTPCMSSCPAKRQMRGGPATSRTT